MRSPAANPAFLVEHFQNSSRNKGGIDCEWQRPMAGSGDLRLKRLLLAAEGYLTLHMPEHALHMLSKVRDPGVLDFEFHRLRAEAYRGLQQWEQALQDFDHCRSLQPKNIDVLMGLAWCYKRVGQLPQAIAVMHAAHQIDGREPIIPYNLACYYSLAKNKSQALSWLGRALRMHQGLVRLVPQETDFDPLRNDPDFQKLLRLAEDSQRRESPR
jgi:tetratricopeptide (TPR) repeat protein